MKPLYRHLQQKISVIVALFGCVAFAADTPPKLRLGEVEKVLPTSYRANLTLDPEKEDFAGWIEIGLDVQQPMQTLWLNATNIAVASASLSRNGQTLSATIIPGGDDFIGFRFESPVSPGRAEIRIDYTGKFELNGHAGIFRTEDGGNHYLLTQFEETDARKAFPCFDEPFYKVPWQMTLHIPARDAAVSNTPVASETTSGQTKTYVFQETRPLPSYLVAFGVGPFEFVDAGLAGRNRIPVRIVTPKGRASEAKYAAEVSATILTRLEDYFGVPYPYAKADQVAIPVSAGFAMENAGMVTYGQTIILAKPETDSEERRRLYALVSAHELAHQWFGNLVTTGWWNDIWLNEAFATWISNKLIAEWKPEWGTRSENVKDTLRAEGRDSLVSSRMIRQEIQSKDDITNAFDDITYQKGAAVIGMFENWMGPESFRSGVKSYMERFAFRTATTADFLDSLSTASRKDVTHAFSTFLDQSGLPIVSVALHCQQDTPKLHLEQHRFLPLGSKSAGTQVWSIPVCVRYGTGTHGQSSCTLMTQPVMDMALGAGSCPAWVQANDKAAGYYRVDYKSDLLDKLTDGKVDDRLSAPERVDLIGNARALAESGSLPEADVLNLVAKFDADSERHVVEAALDLAMSPPKHLVPENLMAKYAAFIRANFQSRAHELGWTPNAGESDELRLLRPELLSAVATYGEDQALAKTAIAMADEWLRTRKGIDPGLIRDVLITAAYYGDESLARRFIAQWKQSDSQEQLSLFFAMAKFRDRQALQTVFQAVLSGDLPATPSSYLYFFAGEDSPRTRDVRFEFLKAHFDQIVGILPDDPFGSAAHLPTVGEGFCDAEAKNDLKSYFEPRLNKLTGAPRTLAQVLEGIDQCIEIKALQQPSVVAFLKGN